MNGTNLRQGIVWAGSWLASLGLAPGSSGNISVRLADGWLMTPTGTALGRLEADRLAQLNSAGLKVAGDNPTKESAVHLAMYEARPAARAVVHLHATYAVALACLADLDPDEPLPPITPYQVMRVFPMQLVPYARPGSAELADAVRHHAQRTAALLLANHGLLIAASSLPDAVFAAEEFDVAARLRFLLDGKPVRRLEPDQVSEIRRSLTR